MEKVESLNYLDYTKQHPEETETLFPAIANVARHIWSLPLPPNIPPWVFRARTTRQPVFLRSRPRGLQRHRGSERLGQSKADRDKQTGPGQFLISSALPMPYGSHTIQCLDWQADYPTWLELRRNLPNRIWRTSSHQSVQSPG